MQVNLPQNNYNHPLQALKFTSFPWKQHNKIKIKIKYECNKPWTHKKPKNKQKQLLQNKGSLEIVKDNTIILGRIDGKEDLLLQTPQTKQNNQNRAAHIKLSFNCLKFLDESDPHVVTVDTKDNGVYFIDFLGKMAKLSPKTTVFSNSIERMPRAEARGQDSQDEPESLQHIGSIQAG